MRNLATTLVLTSILVAGVMAAPSLYAQGSQDQSGSMMGHGMMGDNNTRDEGGMRGMMNMMKRMNEMMDHCNNMMSNDRPNDQWRKNAPSDK